MKNELKFRLNGKNYSWHEQYITGAELRQLAEISADELIFLAVKKPWEDELIKDTDSVNLARPQIEHFYSKKHDDHKPYEIYVNGRVHEWNKRKINYMEVVRLAFPNDPGINTMYTVNYTDGPGQNPEGSMVDGDKVVVKDKMKFNVSATNKS